MKNIFKLFTLMIFFALFSANSAEAIGISPYIVDMTTKKGEDGSRIIKVFNDSKLKFKVDAIAHDIGFDEKGNKIHKPAGFFKSSVAKYVEIIPSSFELSKNETKEVKVIIKTPKEWTGGNGALVLFDAVPAKPDLSEADKKNIKARLDFKLSLGAVILHQVEGTTVSSSNIISTDIQSKKSGRKISFDLGVKNTGNAFIKTSGFISVLNSNDGYVGKVEIPKVVVFPGKTDTINTQFEGQKLEPGEYHALITYEYNDKSIILDKKFKVD